MNDRKPYRSPTLHVYGDVASLTQWLRRKELGPGDFFFLFRPRTPVDIGPAAILS